MGNIAPFRYHGGKHKIADWICSYMPPHSMYVEPFGGGAAVLLRKKPCKTEVYNDIDKEVYGAFFQARHNTEALAQALALTLYSREELNEAYQPTTDALESARRFFVRCNMAISTTSIKQNSGFRAAVNCDDHCSTSYTWSKIPQSVFNIRKRFDRVILENTTAFNLFDRYDLPETLWYLDPPYMNETRSKSGIKRGYTHNLSDEQHIKLIDRVLSLSGFVMISGYDNPLYAERLAKWTKIERRGYTDRAKKSIEVLWMNYKPNLQLF